MFQYKTKGNVSPQGKRRVYFTCHPEDHGRFFEKITGEILKYSDCAIWYNNNDNDYEDINSDLGQMNLFVIPITTRLLTKPCRAMQLDVPFALENHIPILPLMQEEGLDELFSRYFGDLQYLDPNSHDITAISYEEKLKKYLNSVIIGDELAEKVRAAFDAYIFLSYRKKDRKYANELMRLIHKNEFCRDIAIWYDEFLVPGEDFNNAIAVALKKSELFALVVTPNIINEKNYVQTVEYPEATKQHKKVLPVELVKTDHKELSKQYPEIPNCVDIQDEIALSKSFEYALLNIAKKENDLDPEHNFFIGLAYLDGIDVEKNHERALSLITSAAETNKVPEAIEKLVAMYKDGYGVKRDYRKAVEWQKKLVEYWEREYNKSNSKKKFNKLLKALFDFSFDSFNLKDYIVADYGYNKIIEYSNEIEDVNYFFLLGVIYEYGMLNYFDRNLEKVEKCCQYGLFLIDKLIKENYEVSYFQFVFYLLFCDYYSDIGEFKKEESFYQKAISLIGVANNIPVDLVLMLYSKLFMFHRTKGDVDKAEFFLFRALELINQKTNKTYNVKILRGSFNIYHLAGIHFSDKRDFNVCENYINKGISIAKMIYDEIGSLNSLIDIGNCYLVLGHTYIHKGDFEKSIEILNKVLDYYHCVMDEVWTTDIQLIISICYDYLGIAHYNNNNLTDAEIFFRKAIVLKELISEKSDNPSDKHSLSCCYTKLGDTYNRSGDILRAEKYYRKSIVLQEELIKSTIKDEVIKKLGTNYYKLSLILQKLGNLDESNKFSQSSIMLQEQIAKKIGDIETFYQLAVSYTMVGIHSRPPKREYLSKALQILTTIVDSCPQNKEYTNLKDFIKNILDHL